MKTEITYSETSPVPAYSELKLMRGQRQLMSVSERGDGTWGISSRASGVCPTKEDAESFLRAVRDAFEKYTTGESVD